MRSWLLSLSVIPSAAFFPFHPLLALAVNGALEFELVLTNLYMEPDGLNYV